MLLKAHIHGATLRATFFTRCGYTVATFRATIVRLTMMQHYAQYLMSGYQALMRLCLYHANQDGSLSKKKAVVVLALMLLDGEEKGRIKRRNRRVWVRGRIARRQEMGAFHKIVQELATKDPSSYKEYLRMDDWLNTEICVTPLHEMLQMVDTRRNLLRAMLQK